MMNNKNLLQIVSLATCLIGLNAVASSTVKTYYIQFPNGDIKKQSVTVTPAPGQPEHFQVITETEGLGSYTYSYTLLSQEQNTYTLSAEGSVSYSVVGLQGYLANYDDVPYDHQPVWYENSPPAMTANGQFTLPVFNLMSAFPSYAPSPAPEAERTLNRLTLRGRHMNDYSYHSSTLAISTSELVLTEDMQLARMKDLGYQVYNLPALKQLTDSHSPNQRCLQQAKTQHKEDWGHDDRGDTGASMVISRCIDTPESIAESTLKACNNLTQLMIIPTTTKAIYIDYPAWIEATANCIKQQQILH